MGVRTKVFGPFAWRFLHSLARFLDAHGIDYHPYFAPLGFVLPCVYCRSSYPAFYQAERTQRTATAFVYQVHNRVNAKLSAQGERVAAAPSFEEFARGSAEIDLKSTERFFYYCCCDSADFGETLRFFALVFQLTPRLAERFNRLASVAFDTVEERFSIVRFVFGCSTDKETARGYLKDVL
jgi:hypothetical protein